MTYVSQEIGARFELNCFFLRFGTTWLYQYLLRWLHWQPYDYDCPSANEAALKLSLLRRHNGSGGVSNHQQHDCLLKRLFRRKSWKTSKLRVTGLCVGNSPVTGGFPAQMASNAENVSFWWRHHEVNVSNEYIPWIRQGIQYNRKETKHTVCLFHRIRCMQAALILFRCVTASQHAHSCETQIQNVRVTCGELMIFDEHQFDFFVDNFLYIIVQCLYISINSLGPSDPYLGQ